MRFKKGCLAFIAIFQLLIGYSSAGFGLPSFKDIARDKTNDGKSFGGMLPNPIDVIGDIAEKVPDAASDIADKIPDAASDIVDKIPDAASDIADKIPNPADIAKNISQLVSTTAVFQKNNITLNCFGLPVVSFAKAIEKMLTESTEPKDVRFYFSSRSRPDYVTIKLGDEFNLRDTDYDIRRPTILISHGFMSSGKESWLKDMKDAFLKLADVNVIVTDWQKGSNTWNYYSAAVSTRVVGLQIARLFAKIKETTLASNNAPNLNEWGTIYFIGHSLGAHISGHAAFLMKEAQKNQRNSWIVSRITGLDPAQPCFNTANLTLKLDSSDAPYIDIIHTNARHILFLGLGLPDKLGFVDFYPNGGDVQPGCFDIDTTIWTFLLLPKKIVQEAVCSHGRSHAFLTESIINHANNNCTFIGYPWDRKTKEVKSVLSSKCSTGVCTEMGINSASYYPNNNGVYYVPTRDTAPFCGYDENDPESQGKKSLFSRIVKKLF